MNQKQLEEIIIAMEFYFRFMLGQVDRDELRDKAIQNDRLQEYEEWVLYTKRLLFNQGECETLSYKELPLAYEVLREMQHQHYIQTNDNPSEFNTFSTGPLKTTEEPLVEVIIKK